MKATGILGISQFVGRRVVVIPFQLQNLTKYLLTTMKGATIFTSDVPFGSQVVGVVSMRDVVDVVYLVVEHESFAVIVQDGIVEQRNTQVRTLEVVAVAEQCKPEPGILHHPV